MDIALANTYVYHIPLFASLRTSGTPPIWSLCQWLRSIWSISQASSCKTVDSLLIYSGTFGSPVSIKIRLKYKNTVQMNSKSALDEGQGTNY